MVKLKTLLAEPLLQFFSLGLLLFVATKWLATDEQDANTIVVSDEVLIQYLQTQAKSFNGHMARQNYENMSAQEREEMVADFVRDQALANEAIALGLDQNDEVIRRRLIQKMEYVAQGFVEDLPAISEKQLHEYFSLHHDRYREPASITFTHVFFADSKHGRQGADQLARKHVTILNDQELPFEQAAQYGDRFLFKRNYIERTAEELRGHFGEQFEQQLFTLSPSERWQGPFSSDYGLHLVKINHLQPSSLPELEGVASKVLADLRQQQMREQQLKAVEQVLQKYNVIDQRG